MSQLLNIVLYLIPAKAGLHFRMEHNIYLLDGFLPSQERQAAGRSCTGID